MSEYTVVVRARRWQGPPDGLSRALAPVLGVSAEAVEVMLARGPVAVDTDLSEAEAAALVRRLAAMGLPAEAMLEQALLAAVREDQQAAAPLTGPNSSTAQARAVSLFEESEAAAEDAGGWGDIFPELDSAPVPAPAPRPMLAPPARPITAPQAALPQRAAEPSLSELLGGQEMDDLLGALDFGAEPAARPAPGFGAEPVAEPAARKIASLWEDVEPLPPAPTLAAPPSAPRVTAPVAPPARSTGGFEGVRISEAVVGAREGAPPFAPQGFDDQAPHLPWLAALLSGLAPGAGQIYNGQPERAMDHGLWFFAIKPWIEGVRQARRQGERIATYWSPRPRPGALLAALKYAAGWYLVIGVIVGLLSWTVSMGLKRATREELPETAAEDIARALEDARQEAQEARIKGLDAAMAEGIAQRGSAPIADSRERAQRLFLIGLQYCRATQLELCEATMRRVTQLQPGHRDAFRLQAWASLRSKGGGAKPMPEVATHETLSEYELRQISSDMELPMPNPVPEPAPEQAADMGPTP